MDIKHDKSVSETLPKLIPLVATNLVKLSSILLQKAGSEIPLGHTQRWHAVAKAYFALKVSRPMAAAGLLLA
jgi:hypothetical protein